MPALIFDCDGVLADTERYGHLPAFNQAFREFGLPVEWSDDLYAEKVLIGGGKERIASVLTPRLLADAGLAAGVDDRASLVSALHRRKSEIYTALVASGALPARPGIPRLVNEALAAGYTLAVASTSAEGSVRAVLEHVVGADTASVFQVFAGDIVPAKKPAPDIYLFALAQLDLDSSEAVVIEDSANGLRASRAAQLATLVTVSSYTRNEDFSGAALVVSSLGDPGGESTTVLADVAGVRPGEYISIADIDVILASASAKLSERDTP